MGLPSPTARPGLMAAKYHEMFHHIDRLAQTERDARGEQWLCDFRLRWADLARDHNGAVGAVQPPRSVEARYRTHPDEYERLSHHLFVILWAVKCITSLNSYDADVDADADPDFPTSPVLSPLSEEGLSTFLETTSPAPKKYTGPSDLVYDSDSLHSAPHRTAAAASVSAAAAAAARHTFSLGDSESSAWSSIDDAQPVPDELWIPRALQPAACDSASSSSSSSSSFCSSSDCDCDDDDDDDDDIPVWAEFLDESRDPATLTPRYRALADANLAALQTLLRRPPQPALHQPPPSPPLPLSLSLPPAPWAALAAEACHLAAPAAPAHLRERMAHKAAATAARLAAAPGGVFVDAHDDMCCRVHGAVFCYEHSVAAPTPAADDNDDVRCTCRRPELRAAEKTDDNEDSGGAGKVPQQGFWQAVFGALTNFPPAPPRLGGARMGVCELCRGVFSAAEFAGERWRNHVVADLQPYFCTHPECAEWERVPQSLAGLQAHYAEAHGGDMCVLAEPAATSSPGACPFCACTPGYIPALFGGDGDGDGAAAAAAVELLRHIELHMFRVGLLGRMDAAGVQLAVVFGREAQKRPGVFPRVEEEPVWAAWRRAQEGLGGAGGPSGDEEDSRAGQLAIRTKRWSGE